MTYILYSLGYCSLLNPFKWENIVVPIVPDICLELLEAPVPCLMGIQRNIEGGKKLEQTICTQETVIVLLDSSEIIHCLPKGSQKMLKKLPKLSELKANIEKNYVNFAAIKGTYHFTDPIKKSVEEIQLKIESAINKSILNYLPIIPPRTSDKEVDILKVRQELIGHIRPVDEEFVKLFSETQMFASYIDENDKEKLNKIISNKF